MPLKNFIAPLDVLGRTFPAAERWAPKCCGGPTGSFRGFLVPRVPWEKYTLVILLRNICWASRVEEDVGQLLFFSLTC